MNLDERILPALQYQRAAVSKASLSSPLYAAIIDAAIADAEAGGACALVFEATPPGLDPIPDAVVLRFLGAVHRLVLSGGAPALARWFPTAGGSFDPDKNAQEAGRDFLAAVEAHAGELAEGLKLGVQTNEVGRCATLAVGFTELLRRYGKPLRLLEIGASAGLNLRWDRWRYESAGTAWGDERAAITFLTNYRAPAPDVSAPLGPSDAVASREGCDRAPIDPSTAAGQQLLRSFVWPDQAARHERLDAALAAAAEVPAVVDAEDAASWLAKKLSVPVPGVTTVVFHSIVWQYLPRATRDGVREAIFAASSWASPDTPLGWLRMEPGDDPAEAAELKLRSWPGPATDELLAYTGYHGHPVWRP